MLQYITQPNNNRYSVAEQMQMAIEGGCAWIVLAQDNSDDSQLRELAAEFVPLCRESSTILTFENRIEMARELGVHGVVLTMPDANAAKVREELGPEAIIGVTVKTSASVIALKAMDIDYALLPHTMLPEDIARLVAEVRAAGCDVPIVASGDFSLDNIEELLAAGVNGIATGKHIADSEDPVKATRQFINALNRRDINAD